jgi:hypothetical protein
MRRYGRVYCVSLGALTRGLRKVAYLTRIHYRHRKILPSKCIRQFLFEATGRIDRDANRLQLL